MDGIAELLRHRSCWIVGRQDLVGRRLAVGAPVALDLACIHVDHGHTVVEIAIREVGLVGVLIEVDLRDPAETLLIMAVGLIGRRGRRGRSGGAAAGAAPAEGAAVPATGVAAPAAGTPPLGATPAYPAIGSGAAAAALDLASTRPAPLGDELAVAGEFQDVRVAGAVAADIDEAFRVNRDAVVGRRPLIFSRSERGRPRHSRDCPPGRTP